MFTDTQQLKNLVQKTDERFSLTINNLGYQLKPKSALVGDQYIVIQFILLFKDKDFGEKYIKAMLNVKKNRPICINVLDDKQYIYPLEIMNWQTTSNGNVIILTSNYTWYEDFDFLETIDSNSIIDYDVSDFFLETSKNVCLTVKVKLKNVH